MLMPKKRFRFNHTLLYGSAAFVFGFGAVTALLTNFAPVRVPDATIALTPKSAPAEETRGETTPAEQEAVIPASQNTGSSRTTTQPTQQTTPSGSTETPTTPAPSTPAPETTNPEQGGTTPAPSTDPGIIIPVVPELPLPLPLPGVEVVIN